MTGKAPLFGGRPSDPEAWVRRKEQPAAAGEGFTARLTVDVTPALPATIGQRVAFAEAARHGRLVDESEGDPLAAREIGGFARAVREVAP